MTEKGEKWGIVMICQEILIELRINLKNADSDIDFISVNLVFQLTLFWYKDHLKTNH